MGNSKLASIKKRLNAINSTKKITGAMKLVSSSKEKKLINELNEAKSYYMKVESSFNNAVFLNSSNKENDKIDMRLFKRDKTIFKNLIIIITSNSGLCSSYNQNIIKHLKKIFKENDEILVIGEKGKIELIKEKEEFIDDFIDLNKNLNLFNEKEFINYLINEFLSKKYRYIKIVYSHYVNSLISKVIDDNLLPIKLKVNKKRGYSPLCEPDKDEVIRKMTIEFLLSKLNYYLFDSKLSEESLRRFSMEKASNNAQDIIDDLTLIYNKERQTSITSEINEVVSGSKSILG